MINAVAFACVLAISIMFVAVAYTGTAEPDDVTADFGPFLGALAAALLLTAVLVAPWTSLLVRRVRDATSSNIAAFGLAVVAYVGLIAVPLSLAAGLDDSDPLAPLFLLLAALGFLTVAIVCLLPSRVG